MSNVKCHILLPLRHLRATQLLRRCRKAGSHLTKTVAQKLWLRQMHSSRTRQQGNLFAGCRVLQTCIFLPTTTECPIYQYDIDILQHNAGVSRVLGIMAKSKFNTPFVSLRQERLIFP
jgi:hypothetical protein